MMEQRTIGAEGVDENAQDCFILIHIRPYKKYISDIRRTPRLSKVGT